MIHTNSQQLRVLHDELRNYTNYTACRENESTTAVFARHGLGEQKKMQTRRHEVERNISSCMNRKVLVRGQAHDEAQEMN